MTKRSFPQRRPTNGGPWLNVIECGKCGKLEEVPTSNNTEGKHMPPEAASNVFRRRGWVIGSTPRKDRCPECVRTARKTNLKPVSNSLPKAPLTGEIFMSREQTRPDLSLVPPASTRGASAEPPRQMEREDRRIIFAKLEEVYVDEREGYSKGWNDEKVARDLNCPRAWVELVRDENFGPQRTEQSAEVIELSARLTAMEADAAKERAAATKLRLSAEQQLSDARALESDTVNLVKAAEKLRADLNKLIGRA